MVRLEPSDHAAVLQLYRQVPARFPLIGAVVANEQDGTVFVDDPAAPAQAYVEHAFGFAQLLGRPAPAFEAALERYLLTDRSFRAEKVRLYTPPLPEFLKDPRHDSLRSWRQRFVMEEAGWRTREGALRAVPAECDVAGVDGRTVAAVEDAFAVVRRFWRNEADFVAKANAVMVLHRGEPASICYAAALVDGEAEIDVLTRPGHQRLGLGKVAVAHFIARCYERGLAPLWDCFANNVGSMQLSRSMGFTAHGAPYPFFTIKR